MQFINFKEMKLRLFTLSLLIILPFIVDAQKDIKKECVPTTMFSATYSYQFPGADTKDLYKNNSTIGASVIYKTNRNWLWTANANFIFVSHPDKSGKELQQGLRDRGVLVRWFDRPRIRQFLRVSIGTDAEMDAMCAACEEILKG